MTIDEKLARLEPHIRGIWNSRELLENGTMDELSWSVTFIYKGDVVESTPFPDVHDALDQAIEVLGL